MNIRKNIYTLSDAQLQAFQNALNAAKADGSYDDFIIRHHHSMMTATLSPGEVGTATFRNVAHRGPAFLPWHRYFCRELELVLQTKTSSGASWPTRAANGGSRSGDRCEEASGVPRAVSHAGREGIGSARITARHERSVWRGSDS